MTPAMRPLRTLIPRLRSASASAPRPHAGVTVSVAQQPSSSRCDVPFCNQPCRCFAQPHDLDPLLNRKLYFTPSAPQPYSSGRPPDERTLQLGKTIRILHEQLPAILQKPLPQDVLNSDITLHLFPSTHPHLPTTSGRIRYIAALSLAPMGWGRVPLIGNVRLDIISEKMVKNGGGGPDTVPGAGDEKLVVKWKTCSKKKRPPMQLNLSLASLYYDPKADPVDKLRAYSSASPSGSDDGGVKTEPRPMDDEFTGLFIFEFDDAGRIKKHVIEHADECGNWESATRVISVTDWLLGNLTGKRRADEGVPGLAWCRDRSTDGEVSKGS